MLNVIIFKLALVLLISAYSVICYELPPQPAPPPPCEETCLIRVKCSLNESFVYGSDGINCTRFTNQCHLDNENCNRQNRCTKILEQVSAEECQRINQPCAEALCVLDLKCPNIGTGVLGYNGVTCRYFLNDCFLSSVNCGLRRQCQQPYKSITKEECDSLGASCEQTCIRDQLTECSNVGPAVYATDGATCTAYTNSCHLDLANCKRENRCEKPLKLITEAECNNFQPVCNQACNSFTTCSAEGPVVYAKDGDSCITYPNSCQLSVTNCERENRCEKLLEQVSAEECQRLNQPCAEACLFDLKCPNIGTGVLGYNGVACRFFLNECYLSSVNCGLRRQCQQPYRSITKEECDSLGASCEQNCIRDQITLCSNMGPAVYATDGASCNAYTNNCHLDLANCKRENRCEKPLKVISSTACYGTPQPCNQTCDRYLYTKCSREGPSVLATDGVSCNYYPNACQLSLENCYRENSCEKPLKATTEAECKQVCSGIFCPQIFSPVCAASRYELRYFSSICEMSRFNCGNREPFTFLYDGFCEEISYASRRRRRRIG